MLPAQTGNGGLFLTTNGSGVSWDSPLGLVGLDNFRNTFQGKTALTSPTGWDNTAYGYGTLAAGAGATANTGLGTLAFSAVVSGSSNVGVGSRAGYLQLGSDNTAVGGSALYGATPSGTNTGSRNSAFGLESLFKNTTGDSNTALGAQALYSNTTSTKNIAVGYQAGYNLTTGNYNIAIGHLGVAAEANTLRLGTAASGTGASMTGQNRAFIAGIRGATLGGSSPQTVVIDENGQLSSAASTSGTVTSVAALTLTSSSGTDLSSTVATGASTPVITLNVPTASASNRGALSATDWSTFNGKESALTFSSPLSRSTNTISLGTVGVANGGTGLTAGGANGQVLAWASGAPAWQERIPSDAGENTRGGALSLGSLNGGVFNTGFGYQSLAVLTTAGWSTAVGHNALASVTTGSNNTAVGKGALLSVTGGNDNAAVGANALCGLIGGTYNTVMGNYALTQATQVSNSVAMGAFALASQIGGYENTAVGYSALSSLNTGSDNLALGYLAGLGGTYGSNNIYLGANSAASAAGTAGSSITNEIVIGSGATGKGSKTTLLGTPGTTTKTFIAGISGVTPAGSDTAQMVVIKTSGQLGSQDIPTGGSGTVTSVSVISANGFEGSVATATATPAITLSTSVTGLLKGNGTGVTAATAGTDYQAPLTFISPLSNTSNQVSLGTVAVANGGTGLTSVGVSGTVLTSNGSVPSWGPASLGSDAKDNTMAGLAALGMNTSGAYNAAVGSHAMGFNTEGNDNAAFGNEALLMNLTGLQNTAIGRSALGKNKSSYNTAVGANALYSDYTGSTSIAAYNTAVGANALYNIGTGNNNIALGYGAGGSVQTGDYNIDIGHQGLLSDTNTIRIGDPTHQTTTYIAGISGAVVTGVAVQVNASGQLGVVASSRRFKENIQPMADLSSRLFGLRPVTFTYKAEYGGGGLQYGLIAEEVDQVIPEMTVRDKDGQIQTVAYQMLPPMLLNEAQKQQKVIEALQARVEAQQAELDTLKAQMAKVLARLPQ